VAVAGFNQLLQTMAQMDFFTGVLPFVLTYVVLYAGLREVPVISDTDKNFPALIAIIGAFFLARFVVVNPAYQGFFVQFFGKLTVGLMGFIGLLILLAFTGYNLGENGGLNTPLVVMVMVAVAGSAFATSGGLGVSLPAFQSMQLQSMLGWTLESGMIWILLVGAALWWVSSDGSGSTQDTIRPFFSNEWWTQMMDDSDE
jgi:hypothetical protein